MNDGRPGTPEFNKYHMRINEDYIDNVKPDELADDYSNLSMDVRQNVEWLLNDHHTNIDFNVVDRPIYKPKNKKELFALIRICIKKYGEDCNLNWIDVSGRHNFSGLFYVSSFNGDISKWDVSDAVDMDKMFLSSKFNGNISGWDVSNVRNMYGMFCASEFDQDISSWDIRYGADVKGMFKNCPIRDEYKPKRL